MKILLVGAHGTIGRAVQHALSRHQILAAGRNSGALRVDMTQPASIRALFERVGKVDAIICAAGLLHLGPLVEMTPEQFRVGLDNKLMGQVNLALIGQHFLNAGGSITLTSGMGNEIPIRHGSNACAVNAAIEGFARGAAVELAAGLRINVVCPAVLQESWEPLQSYFPGFEAVPATRVALAYQRSVEGVETGQVLKVW
ncbi:short chain dehydrogenase [Chromobacterium sp. IIBBL 290-4]|uniref:short chain dehydrogenase n=1 Tax=Chromobacterium sp. IIBBL 290-4 TaxID=2953890 RepID=UPI0020B674EF|nr:short chain dehydrogenase [Chromobacterium sp. IIBBL 290-4]UTH74939.1 short chain dehydrogenase [Chromobacterium sp. IIBBL 290-4]